MALANMHIHSSYSWDSKMKLTDVAETLIKNKVFYAGIADHVEFDRVKPEMNLINLQYRNEEIDKLNDKYKGKIKLLKGVEISEPHLYKREVEKLSVLNLDFIMGSIHQIIRNPNNNLQKREYTRIYYDEMLNMVKANQIDILGHIDYINRYYNGDYSDYKQISEILYAMRENNIVLELNSSSKRRSCKQLAFPDIDKLSMYKYYGKYVTVGTDAHQVNELLDNLDQTEYLANMYDLKQVIFKKRKMKELEPPTYS